jgi:hypothetical protein
MTRTFVFLFAAIVAGATHTTIMVGNWEVESGNGDFGIGKLFSCDA